jgi:rubrerythrin
MAEYIEREELINQIRLMVNRSSVGEISLSDISAKTLCGLILEAPTADMVSREVFEQVKWERDTALKTLEEHGIGLGQKADVVEVKHGKWIYCPPIRHLSGVWQCSVCKIHYFEHILDNFPYCPYCGAKMDLKG